MNVKRLGWGLIGCGDIARKRVAPALRDLETADLVAVCRARPELAAEFALEFGARRWYAGWREMLADSEVEAVYVATPVHLHAPITIAAAEAGRHVLCEKPMALDLDECDAMISAVRENHVHLGMAYYRRFYPVLGRIAEILRSGEVGAPVLVRMDAFEFYDPSPDDPRYWFLQKQYAGGGPMFDFGCHRIEVLLRLFGEPETVEGRTWNLQHKGREVEDTSTALFGFRGGVMAQLTVSHAVIEARDTLEILGSRGSIHVPVLNRGSLKIKSPNGERVEEYPPHPNIHFPLIEDFTRSMLEGKEPTVNGEIGRQVNRILEEIYHRRQNSKG